MNDLEGWILDKRYEENHDFSNMESRLWSSTTQEKVTAHPWSWFRAISFCSVELVLI